MSGAQGAQPPESKTATTYELRYDQINKLQDKVQGAAGKGGPVFGAGKDESTQDLGVTGTAANENLT
ncbi:hypothetical protein ACB092_11G006200 [Castanea dentata]